MTPGFGQLFTVCCIDSASPKTRFISAILTTSSIANRASECIRVMLEVIHFTACTENLFNGIVKALQYLAALEKALYVASWSSHRTAPKAIFGQFRLGILLQQNFHPSGACLMKLRRAPLITDGEAATCARQRKDFLSR